MCVKEYIEKFVEVSPSSIWRKKYIYYNYLKFLAIDILNPDKDNLAIM